MSFLFNPYRFASSDSDALAYLSAVEVADGQALESTTKQAIETFIVGCKTDGIWNAIKASCILAGARTLAGALIPLVGIAPTTTNYTDATYNRKTGLKGNGSSTILDTNRLPNADPQDNFHGVAYGSALNMGGGGIRTYLASRGSACKNLELFYNGISNPKEIGFNNRVALAANQYASIPIPTSGMIGSSRSSGTLTTVRVAGISYTSATASVAPDSSPDYTIPASNLARLQFYSLGEHLDLALLEARLTTLMSSINTAF